MAPSLALLLICSLGQTMVPNLVDNPSFERVDEQGRPLLWNWSAGAAKGSYAIDDSTARSGQQSLRITNPAKRSPNVFCELHQVLRLQPNRTYTLSCYVKGPAGTAWIGGGPGWKVRRGFPAGQDWQRVSQTFQTGGDGVWDLLILSEDVTPGFWVDDVLVEEGPVASPFLLPEPLEPGQLQVSIEPDDGRVNLLPNPSFEQVKDDRPVGWSWDPRNTDATLTLDSPGHLGERRLKVTNATPFGAHVYALLRAAGEIEVEPGVTYTLSYYCRTGSSPGRAWVGGGDGWWVRVGVPRTNGEWQRVSRTFTTKETSQRIPLMIITESPTDGFWIDDVQLERKARATAFEDPSGQLPAHLDLTPVGPLAPSGEPLGLWKPDVYPPAEWIFTAHELRYEGGLRLKAPVPGGALELTLTPDQGQPVTARIAPDGGLPARAAVDIRYGLPNTPLQQLTLHAKVVGQQGEVVSVGPRAMKVVTPATIEAKLAQAEARLPQLEQRAKTDDDARCTASVIRNFAAFARTDLQHEQLCRAYDQAVELDQLGAAALAAPPRGLAPRYVTSPLTIAGPTFLGQAKLPDGKVVERPIYFNGYGHFGSVRRGVEGFPDYGLNLIQIEFGPRSVLVAENTVDDRAIDEFISVCERAAKSNVQVNLLLSPHYFPDWALDKWPRLKQFSGGFLKYCIYDPAAKGVIEQSLRHVIPRIKDLPALHSLCLSNEPIVVDLSGSEVAVKMWQDWLAKRFGDLATINRRWGTQFKSLETIPAPPPKFDASAMVYDFTLFNQETFADWHRWMADIIHDLAPNIPVHAKIMMSAHFAPSLHGCWSVAPELFSDLSQLNGNDCCKWPGGGGDWACDWLGENMGYDYQRSAADLPVFNSEDHLIVDGTLTDVSPEFIRNVYWQGAIHGQGAETTWVWERTNELHQGFTGSIMHRPKCAREHGLTSLDLNRAATEVAALAGAPAQVALLWSQASLVWRGGAYRADLRNAYAAANFLDVPLGFINERDCTRYVAGAADRAFATAKVILLPGCSHVPPEVLQALAKFRQQGGTIVPLGECLTHDETGRAVQPPALGAVLPIPSEFSDLPALTSKLREQLVNAGVRPVVPVDQFGVEARSVTLGGARLVNLSNYLREPVKVTLPGPATEVLSGAKVGLELTVEPLVPRLLRLE